ncbi:MAG: response regulator, partial [bacterium]|nr:response regulator [bacterium]
RDNGINGIGVLDKTLYVATDNGLSVIRSNGVGRFRVDNRLNSQPGFPSGKIKGIGIESKGKYPDSKLNDSRVWLFGDRWFGYLEENSAQWVPYPVGITFSDRAKTVLVQPDYRNGLYVANRYDTYYFNYNTRTWQSLGIINGLIDVGANSLFIDFEKNVWIPCLRGVSKISSRRFSNFKLKHGLLEDEVTAVKEYEPGRFILGHNWGVTFYDTTNTRSGPTFFKVPFFGPNQTKLHLCRVLDIQVDSKKNIWLAASQAGLIKINRRRQLTRYGKNDGLPRNIFTLWISPQDRVWVGTETGLYVQTGTGFRLHKIGDFPPIVTRRIFGHRGKLRYIAGMSTGVYVYREEDDKWENFRTPGNIKANTVYAVREDFTGRLLVGTRGGLFTLKEPGKNSNEPGILVKFQQDGFGIDRPVYFIFPDNRQRLWFGTDNGVIQWDGAKTKTFSIAEGLTGHETNRAAGMMDSRGRFWFGTNRGLSIYDESYDNNPSFNPPPMVRILNITLPQRQVRLDPPTGPVRLSYKENTIIFHFRGISFLDETAIRFKTKLEGFDQQWSAEGYPYKQMVRYTNLSPGTYRFHLKARNSLGVWSPEVVSPAIVILKPFYEEWWFYLSLIVLVFSIFYVVFRFFTRGRYAALLEHQVEERSAQLQAVEKRYHDLFQESVDTVFVSTPEGTLMNINPAGVRLFGYGSKEELLGITSTKNLFENPEDREKYSEAIEKKGFVQDYELALKRKDGEPINAQVTATLVRDKEGNVIAYRGIIRDVTEKIELEQQLVQAQKMEAIGTLAGGIAHDFNNILGVITGYSELAIDELEEGTLVRRNVEQILTGAERATELVRQILAFSRQNERKRMPLQLSLIITEVLKLLRPSLPSTIEIRTDIQTQSGLAMADPTQIHQVMMNLCANSAHAMKNKKGILEIKLHEVHIDPDSVGTHEGLPAGNYLRLTVSDTGHGIPQIVKKRIFEPYFTTKDAGEGTGMGLAVIHGIVKSHGGDITVYSEPGEGTTFNVYLPQLEDSIKPPEEVIEETLTGSERVLLIDDETNLARVEGQMLKRLGYDVTVMDDALEALETFRREPDRFNIVVTDLTMPQLTGIQLSRELRNISPALPIILCSGFSTIATQQKIKAYGISDFVMKPIIKNQLARSIRKILDNNH